MWASITESSRFAKPDIYGASIEQLTMPSITRCPTKNSKRTTHIAKTEVRQKAMRVVSAMKVHHHLRARTKVKRVIVVSTHRSTNTDIRRTPAEAARGKRRKTETRLEIDWNAGCAVGLKVGWQTAALPASTGCVRTIRTCGRSTNVGPMPAHGRSEASSRNSQSSPPQVANSRWCPHRDS